MEHEAITALNAPNGSPEQRNSNIIISTIDEVPGEDMSSQEIRDSKQWVNSYLNDEAQQDNFRRKFFSKIKKDLKKNLGEESTDTSSNDVMENKFSPRSDTDSSQISKVNGESSSNLDKDELASGKNPLSDRSPGSLLESHRRFSEFNFSSPLKTS